MTEESEKLANRNGGTWGEHPEYPLADWQDEVANDYTRQGYWEWVVGKIEASTE